MITVLYEDRTHHQPISYILDYLLSIIGKTHSISPLSDNQPNPTTCGLLMTYGRKKPQTHHRSTLHVYQSQGFFDFYGKAESLPSLPLPTWNGTPVLYKGTSDPEIFVHRSNDSIDTNIDIVASSFFLMSRYEEVIDQKFDKFGRYPASAGVLYKQNFIDRPIVNEYIEMLAKWIADLDGVENPEESPFTGPGRPFYVCMTHDIDSIRKHQMTRLPRAAVVRSIRDHSFRQVPQILVEWLLCSLSIRPDPYWTFDLLLESEHNRNISSTYFLLAGGGSEYDKPGYSLRSHRMKKLIRRLIQSGNEIGLHGSFNSYNEYQILENEKKRIDQSISGSRCAGNRQHYLRWETPLTWRLLERAGIRYDTTLGFAAQEGFRCGICYPFKPFDIVENRIIDIWEVPLMMMDATMFYYQSFDIDTMIDKAKSLINIVQRYNGVMVILVHNTSFDQYRERGFDQFYIRMLDYISEQEACACTISHFLANWEHRLVRSGMLPHANPSNQACGP